jgi:hypothetical protein
MIADHIRSAKYYNTHAATGDEASGEEGEEDYDVEEDDEANFEASLSTLKGEDDPGSLADFVINNPRKKRMTLFQCKRSNQQMLQIWSIVLLYHLN